MQILKKIKTWFIGENITFILNIFSLFSIIKSIYETNINIENMSEYFNVLFTNLSKNLSINDLMLFICTIILFKVLRSYKKLKKDMINHINYISEELTKNMNIMGNELNDNFNNSNRILHNKIHYMDLYLANKHLTNDELIKKINDGGFSKEDLEEIGVNDEFLNSNKSKLLPRKVISKFIEFKIALYNYNKEKNEPKRTAQEI